MFWIAYSVSATYFMEVSARVSLRVATKSLFRGKKSSKITIFDNIIVKQKRKSAIKKN